jgi:hypothetical protein
MARRIPVDRASVFRELCNRNALRREAHLPLLNVASEYKRLVDVQKWSYIVEHHYAVTRAEILAYLRATRGPDFGNSAGGRWMIEIFTTRELRVRYWC